MSRKQPSETPGFGQKLKQVIDELAKNQERIAKIEADNQRLLSEAAKLADGIAEEQRELSRQARDARPCTHKTACADPEKCEIFRVESHYQQMSRLNVCAQIGARMRVSDRTVARWVAHAESLTGDYAATQKSLQSGKISKAHTIAMCDAGIIITDPEKRAQYESIVLTYAEKESVNRVRAFATRVAERFTDRPLEERAEAARAGREVTLRPLDDDLGLLSAVLPLTEATAMMDRLSKMAKRVWRDNRKARTLCPEPNIEEDEPRTSPTSMSATELAASDLRTIAQIRADLLIDLVLTGRPAAHDATGLETITPHVQVVIPLLSLLPQEHIEKLRDIPGFETLLEIPGMQDQPHIVGQGPINIHTAKFLAGCAPGWDRMLTHPVTGVVEHVDRYQPTDSLKRYLRARDEHCRFPGCRVPVRRCEIDHTVDWAFGGKTTASNLAHLCPKHHRLKHHTEWSVTQHRGGVLEWVSPNGQSYHEEPPSSVAFMPAPF